MSNTYKTRELMTVAHNADNSVECRFVWYRTAAPEYVVFSPLPNGRIKIDRFEYYTHAMTWFEELTNGGQS